MRNWIIVAFVFAVYLFLSWPDCNAETCDLSYFGAHASILSLIESTVILIFGYLVVQDRRSLHNFIKSQSNVINEAHFIPLIQNIQKAIVNKNQGEFAKSCKEFQLAFIQNAAHFSPSDSMNKCNDAVRRNDGRKVANMIKADEELLKSVISQHHKSKSDLEESVLSKLSN